jgi:nitrite reductase (NADH) small subunit
MTEWIEFAPLSELPPEGALEHVVADRVIVIFRRDATLYAIDLICSHQGGLLSQGDVHGSLVCCPWHGWQFDMRSGQCTLNPKVCQKT